MIILAAALILAVTLWVMTLRQERQPEARRVKVRANEDRLCSRSNRVVDE